MAHQDELLKRLYRRLHEQPLRADDPEDVALYEPIYKPTDEHDEPIELLARHIRFSEIESLQLFSGFRGSGKTTELLRLQQRLRQLDYVVIYANALDYINPAGPIDISDLLITIAGAFSDTLEKDPSILGQTVQVKPFWERLKETFSRLNISLDVSLKAGVEIKTAIKASPTLRQKIQEAMASHIGTLKQEVDRFFEEGRKAIWTYQGDAKQIVFLFDSLEQLRGNVFSENDVLQSVQKLFDNHFDKLRLPSIHTIYTVPPWLKFVSPGIGRIEILPSIRQWNNDQQRTPYEPGNSSLRSLLRRRMGDDGCQQLFGDPARADRLIAMCGGHLRDLLRLLGETILRARDLPASDAVIERAIVSARSQYLPLSVEDALWLERIATERRTDQENFQDIGRLMRFLDSHMVLYLVNGAEWYDVHPLIREEAQQIAASHRKRVADDAAGT